MNTFTVMAIALLFGAQNPSQPHQPPRPTAESVILQKNPFKAAAVAPEDVDLYVHVENAADLRRQIADRPIARWVNGLIETGQVRQAWSALAKAASVDEGALFDGVLGRRCTLVRRQDSEWVIITEIDDATLRPVVQNLKARVREPRHGMAIVELPEQGLLVARNGNVAIIGPVANAALLQDILQRLDTKPEADAPPTAIQTSALQLGTGRIGVWLKHSPPMGGHSVAVADINGDQLVIRHAANFEHAPFSRGVTKLQCDFSPVLNFEDKSLIALMQPTDVGDGPVEMFLTASLGEGLMSRDMRQNTGDRRMLVFNEVEGRLQPRPSDLLNTTMTVCVQVKDPSNAVAELDDQMVKVTGRLNALGKGAYLIQTPPMRTMPLSQPREVSLEQAGEAAQWFNGGFPIMQNVSLNWTVADGPSGAWYVIASHRDSLDEVVGALQREPRSEARFVGKFDNCGVSNGLRLGRHLRNWSDQSAQLAQPGREEEFQSTLRLMSELAGGMQNCRWQLARPSQNEMRLDVQIKLAPAESATGE